MHLVNGFEVLADEATILPLTQSFRCSENIAKKIQQFMRSDVNPNFKFVGTDEPVQNGKFLYCTATNGMIIKEISNQLERGMGFNLLRKISDIFAYPMDIITAGRGKKVYHKKHAFLEDEYKEYEKIKRKGYSWLAHLLECVADQETKTAVNLILSLNRKNISLFDLYNQAKNADVDLDYTIATVYTAKGLEFEAVHIADDLNNRIEKIREDGGIQNHDDLVAFRCYYVAASRCGVNLINAVSL